MIKSNKGRIPGPAGDLLSAPDLTPWTSQNGPVGSQQFSDHRRGQVNGPESSFSQSSAWRSMLDAFGNEEAPPTKLLAQLSKSGSPGKVPRLAASIACLESIYDAYATFRDDSGFMQGTIHRKVIEEQRGLIEIGAVLVLRNVSIFSPTASDHFLNICPANIEQVFPYCARQDGESRSARNNADQRTNHDECRLSRPRPGVSQFENERLVRQKTSHQRALCDDNCSKPEQNVQGERNELSQAKLFSLPQCMVRNTDSGSFTQRPKNEQTGQHADHTTSKNIPKTFSPPFNRRLPSDLDLQSQAMDTFSERSPGVGSITTSSATRSSGVTVVTDSSEPSSVCQGILPRRLTSQEPGSERKQPHVSQLPFFKSAATSICSQTVQLPDINMDLLEENALDL